jgi:hypothetical protein
MSMDGPNNKGSNNMRTKTITIDGIKTQCLLMAGGSSFKVYSIPNGWLLVIGKLKQIINENDIDYELVTKYINLKYQTDRNKVKQDFDELINLRKHQTI